VTTTTAVDVPPVQVFEPHRAGVPKLGPYVQTLFRRRHFALELSRASIRSAHSDTIFGQLWLVLNPTLTAAVYYLLVIIIGGGRKGPDFFVHLIAALFAFHFVAGAMVAGAESVVGGGKLVLNTSFPLVLLPMAALRTSVQKFLPTMVIFLGFFVYFDFFAKGMAEDTLHFSPYQLLAIPCFGLIIVFAAGMALLMATLQVYFRDMTNFLPYVTRMWMYLSPVLYLATQMKPWMLKFEMFNPLFYLLGIWGETLVHSSPVPLTWWLAGSAWAFGTFAVGAFVFLSKESEFPVRL
jgi:ABC-type polysaccharide/polyol phosphate export permease